MTKQYTLIYILLGVLMFAVSAFTAAALREANTTYDLTALKAAQTALAQQVADQIVAQESAMAAWAAEATLEAQTANTDVEALRKFTCESIALAAVGGGTGTLDATAVDDCMSGASTTNGAMCQAPYFPSASGSCFMCVECDEPSGCVTAPVSPAGITCCWCVAG